MKTVSVNIHCNISGKCKWMYTLNNFVHYFNTDNYYNYAAAYRNTSINHHWARVKWMGKCAIGPRGGWTERKKEILSDRQFILGILFMDPYLTYLVSYRDDHTRNSNIYLKASKDFMKPHSYVYRLIYHLLWKPACDIISVKTHTLTSSQTESDFVLCSWGWVTVIYLLAQAMVSCC